MTAPAKAPVGGALVLALCGCFNASAFTPILVSVQDNANSLQSVATGSTRASVSGKFFSPGVTVYWNGKALPTTWQSASSVEIALGTSETALAGTAQITAANEGGLLSAPLKVTVFDAPLTLTRLDPPQAAPGSGPLTLTVTGTGFTPGSQILWNGTALTTTFGSSTSLSATVPASLLTIAGEGFVQVDNQQCLFRVDLCVSAVVPFDIGPSNKTTVQAPAGDIAWDATHSLLFIASNRAATVTALDPVTATLGTSTTLPGGPVQLSISDQDLFLYMAVKNGAGVPATRLSLPGLTNPTQVPSGREVIAIAAAPGAPETAAFTPFTSIGVLDGTAVRAQMPNVLSPTAFTWGFDASTLFAVDVSSQLVSYHVDATGVSAPTVLNSGHFSGKLYYDRTARLLYDDAGEVFDEQGAVQAAFALPASSCLAAMDGAGGRMFFACSEPAFGLTLRSFDLASRQPLSRVLLELPDFKSSPPSVSSAARLVRWGPNGLAVASSSGSLDLYSGPFVR